MSSYFTVALYTTLVVRHLFATGHVVLSLQLQFFPAPVVSSLDSIFVLWDFTMLSILVVHEYDSLTVFLLKMQWNGCCLGKCSCKSLKNSLPMLVATFLLNGGLYHTILLLRFLEACVVLLCSASYFSSLEYPALPKALS